MWLIIFGLTIASAIAGIIYLCTRFQRFYTVRRIAGDRKALRLLLALIPVLIAAAFFMLDGINTIIVVIHLMLFWILGDLLTWIIKRIRGVSKKETAQSGPYYTGILVIVFTAVYLFAGWQLAHHVSRTVYELQTDKDLGQDTLKVVLFADSHIGATFGADGFAEHMKEIAEENADLVLIAGDYVDDDTTKEDMVKSCQALGELKPAFGVFYVFGNHDKGYYDRRDFSYGELTEELEKNGVVVLEDETVLINDSFYLIGRKDKSDPSRKSAGELTQGLDPGRYRIMMDHQPNDYEKETEAGADLVLSGHTHGGQLIPVTRVGEWIGANDRTYGYEKRNDTEFIVTSGISDWAIKFKTGTKSEYVVLNIEGGGARR